MKFLIDLPDNAIKKLESKAKTNGRSRKAEAEQIIIEELFPIKQEKELQS